MRAVSCAPSCLPSAPPGVHASSPCSITTRFDQRFGGVEPTSLGVASRRIACVAQAHSHTVPGFEAHTDSPGRPQARGCYSRPLCWPHVYGEKAEAPVRPCPRPPSCTRPPSCPRPPVAAPDSRSLWSITGLAGLAWRQHEDLHAVLRVAASLQRRRDALYAALCPGKAAICVGAGARVEQAAQ
jgi:hypothetical protein